MTDEQKALVVDNLGLAYTVLSKYYPKVQTTFEYEDAQQTCLEGLIQAAITYDNTRNVAFSTYAFTVIKRHLFRVPILELKKRTDAFITSVTSLDDLLQDEETSLIDTIPIDYNLESDYIQNTNVDLLYKFINELDEPQKSIMLLRCKNRTFKQISFELKIPESTVQQHYKKALNILRYKYDKNKGGY